MLRYRQLFPSVLLKLSLALNLCGWIPIAEAQPDVQTESVPQDQLKGLEPSTTLAAGPGAVSVTIGDLEAELSKASDADRRLIFQRPGGVQQVVNNLLVRRMLATEAERDRLSEDPSVSAVLRLARDRVLSDARLATLDKQNEPSEAALDAYAKEIYNAKRDQFIQPAQTRARHILLANNGPEALTRAKELVQQLRNGASFEEMAKQQSTDTTSAAKGGDLGFIGPGQMVRPFEDAVRALVAPGDISEPVESQFGYHIIKLEERRAPSPAPFEEIRPKLIQEARIAILNESRVQKVQSLVKGLTFEKAAIDSFVKGAAR